MPSRATVDAPPTMYRWTIASASTAATASDARPGISTFCTFVQSLVRSRYDA